ncbi:MAG: ABC-2 family transporter protein, partial [Elusimicrobia bacterium]|nr:ABC-2 family transporter protein [Elusimicrobiota bacterium]
MKKYLYAYAMSLQNVLQLRASLLMDRVGGIAILTTLYAFWSALLPSGGAFLGYDRTQMLTYVLVMNLLRSFVFTGRGWDLVREISSGRISGYLLRPIDYRGYSLALDLSQKTIHLGASLLEVAFLILVLRAPLRLPERPETWALFAAAAALSSLIFFALEFCVASLAFWTSESAGPLFCFELFLQFAAGVFFPLDVLPAGLRRGLDLTPFPYMVFLPIQIFL